MSFKKETKNHNFSFASSVDGTTVFFSALPLSFVTNPPPLSFVPSFLRRVAPVEVALFSLCMPP